LELFARHKREGWSQWGNEVDKDWIEPDPVPLNGQTRFADERVAYSADD